MKLQISDDLKYDLNEKFSILRMLMKIWMKLVLMRYRKTYFLFKKLVHSTKRKDYVFITKQKKLYFVIMLAT